MSFSAFTPFLFPLHQRLKGGGGDGQKAEFSRYLESQHYQGPFGKLARMSAYNHFCFITYLQCKTSA